MIEIIINKEEAIAWIKKYFKAVSLDEEFFSSTRRGIKEIILSSRAIHALNQVQEEIARIDLEKVKIKNKVFKLFKINKGTLVNVLHYGV